MPKITGIPFTYISGRYIALISHDPDFGEGPGKPAGSIFSSEQPWGC